MKPIALLFVFLLFSTSTYAQDSNFELSEPVNVHRLGWDKVLQMDNGNTLLFHLQPRKAIIVKVFDKSRKEIASHKHYCEVADINALERSQVKGIYKMGEEAVMFLTQYLDNRETLVRLRFSTADGRLIEEVKLIQSPTFKNKTSSYVMTHPEVAGYSIFCFKDLEIFPDEQLKLISYNAQHEQTAEITLPDVGIDTVHYAKMVSADMGKDGSILVTLQMSKIRYFPEVLDKFLITCYLPAGAQQFQLVKTNLDPAMEAHYARYTYNPLSKNLNLLLTTLQLALIKEGLQPETERLYIPYMLMYNRDDLSQLRIKRVSHKLGNDLRKQTTGTDIEFRPAPLHVFATEDGLTTIVAEEHGLNAYQKGVRTASTYIGNIGITQVNDKGAEVWGTVIPKAHYLLSPVDPYEHAQRGRVEHLFIGDHDETYAEQYSSTCSYMAGKNLYIIYNDAKGNFQRPPSEPVDTVYHYRFTHAMYQKLNENKELTQGWLFGKPEGDESKAAMIESSDYNEQTHTYAGLVLCRKGKKYELRMGWRQLQ